MVLPILPHRNPDLEDPPPALRRLFSTQHQRHPTDYKNKDRGKHSFKTTQCDSLSRIFILPLLPQQVFHRKRSRHPHRTATPSLACVRSGHR